MKACEYLLCKKSIYVEDEIFFNGNNMYYNSEISFKWTSYVLFSIVLIKNSIQKLFKRPIFKKGKEYKADVITQTYTIGSSYNPSLFITVSDIVYHITSNKDSHFIPKGIVYNTFYTTQELRKIKLKKLK